MTYPIANRIKSVQTPVIPTVGQWVTEHPGTISLGQGVVHYGPPSEIENGLSDFKSDPLHHRYKLVQGIPELLQAIEEKLRRDNGMAIESKDRVMVTAGSNMAFECHHGYCRCR